jgi:fibronectin type 3 domain-containing protein
MQPTVGTGVNLSWEPPSTGPVTGYRIYRGVSPYSQTLLATVENVSGFNDASAGASLYFYVVTAVNAAGEGPPSNITGMIGKTAAPAGVVREDARRFVITGQQLRPAWGVRWA